MNAYAVSETMRDYWRIKRFTIVNFFLREINAETFLTSNFDIEFFFLQESMYYQIISILKFFHIFPETSPFSDNFVSGFGIAKSATKDVDTKQFLRKLTVSVL